jgi:hypothetical protein
VWRRVYNRIDGRHGRWVTRRTTKIDGDLHGEILRGLKPKEVAQMESYVVQGCVAQMPKVKISDNSTFASVISSRREPESPEDP